MSKYDPLWKWINKNKTNDFKLTYAEIENIVGVPIDHSFLTFKKELLQYGFRVAKISMKEQTVTFEKQERQNNMELVSDYMHDDTLRHALNELTRKTFCFDFKSWVMGGYFEGDYTPYSFMENGKIVSNVSANRMTFLQNGVEKHYIQIGTVMTDENYRKQGLAKKLIEHVIKQYENECDGFYLFANLSAVDFYDKCGFSKEMEYRYAVKEEFCGKKPTGEIFMPVNTA